MPELPEVETIARQLNKVLVGQKIIKAEVLVRKSFIGQAGDVEGKKIVGVRRKAKMVIIELASSSQRLASSLLIHLKMTGQLIYKATSYKLQATSRHTRVILYLTRGKLFFNDQRMFGWMKVVDKKELEKEFKNYGPDIIDTAVTEDYFYGLLQRSRRAVKLVITDQAKVAGVGNIYANEGLWCAKISPMRKAQSLTRQESHRLLAGLRKVVEGGIKYGGATASDESYVNASGLEGKYKEHFLAYEREGKQCKKCKSVIRKTRLGGRGTYYCPVCQR